jgi:prephenate dehydrogenase
VAEPPFHNIAIVGFGLIGGSIALAARERWAGVRITGIDRAPVLAHAVGSGAIDRQANAIGDLTGIDLLVLAAPVEQNVRMVPDAVRCLGPDAVVTDVGGTKRDIVAAASGVADARAPFVGGHPIGGAERGGFGFSRADLFRGRPWIFTPAPSAPQSVVDRLFAFTQGLGAKPTVMDAAAHDRLMAFLSHLPQLTASALMDVVGKAAGADGGLRVAGRGLVDTTRLASSPADIWRDICAANADDIAVALDALIARLQELRAGLQDGKAVDSIFDEAARRRTELMKGREP